MKHASNIASNWTFGTGVLSSGDQSEFSESGLEMKDATGVVFRRASDCETESWRDPVSGHVDWWTLFSADRTPTTGLTVGIAEVPVDAPRPPRGHTHEQAEVYVFLSGSGEVVIAGESTPVSTGDAVFIPGNVEHMSVNTGNEPLRLLYFFAADSFTDIEYKFPGQE